LEYIGAKIRTVESSSIFEKQKFTSNQKGQSNKMVQGQGCRYTKAFSALESEQTRKQQDALAAKQKEERERKQSAHKADVSAKKGVPTTPKSNPWGATFKNREHFNSLHFC
jgi:hypothetical protein